MKRQVTMLIKNGKVITANFEGFQGHECTRLEETTRPPGLEIDGRDMKPEFYEQNEWETEKNV